MNLRNNTTATGLLDAYIYHVLKTDDLEDIVGIALLLCDIHLGLPEQTEKSWASVLREGGIIYDVLFRAMRGLMENDRELESFQLAQRWKAPLFTRPYIDEWRNLMPPRQALELNGFYSAFDTLKEGVRQLQVAQNIEELSQAIHWTLESGQTVHDELDRRSLADPIQALRLGRIVFPDELIDALPERGGAVCLLDFLVSSEGTFIHILGRYGGKVEIIAMIAKEFKLAHALELAGIYDSLLVQKTNPENQDEALDYISEVLHVRLWCNLAKLLGERGFSQIIIVPDAWTRALPHHLSKVCGKEVSIPRDVPLVQQDRIADLFPIEFSPSVQTVAITQWQLRPKHIRKLVMAADPNDDLPGAAWTANWIKPNLPEDLVYKELVGKQATRNNLMQECNDANLIVFCGHGDYCHESPVNSYLKLSDGQLTLADVIKGDGVVSRAVYVLSACELGTGFPGETIRGHAFPGAFLAGGGACVLAALWEMEDISFGYLTERFLHHLAYPGRRPAAALFRAMNDTKEWGRDEVRAHIKRMLKWMEESGRAEAQPAYHLRLAELLMWVEDESGLCPFREEKYWGGAVVFGSGWSFQSGAHITDYEHPMRYEEEVILGKKGEQIAEMIKNRQFRSAQEKINEWLSWAHGPERIEPCVLQADLARNAGADPRFVINLYRRLSLLSLAHEDKRTESYAIQNIQQILM